MKLALALLMGFGLAEAQPVAVPPPVPALPLPDFPIPEVVHLSSGAPVWVVERRGVPLVRVEVSLRGGQLASADPLALQLAGVLLDDGVRGRSASEWQDALADLGATAALGTSSWRSWGDVEFLAGDEAAAVPLLAEALLRPRLAAREVRRVRRAWVRAGEQAWSSADAVSAAALTRLTLGPDHPLGALWDARDYRALRRARARRAWTDQLAHANLAVVVVGDTTPEAIVPVLEAAFGDLSVGGPAAPLPAPIPHQERRVLVDHPGVQQTRVTLSMPAPAAFTDDAPTADRLADAFCGAFASRLNLRLREEEGWTYGVSCAVEARPGYGRLVLHIPTRVEHAGAVLAVTSELLDAAAVDLPTTAEWAASRHAAVVQGARALQSASQVAWRLGRRLTHHREPDEERSSLHAGDDATVEDARALARRLFGSPDRTWIIVGDARSLEPVLDAAGLPPDLRLVGASVVQRR